MSQSSNLDWAMPVMRAGYIGRGLVYTTIAGISLWAISRGGEAKGTESALAALERSSAGPVVLGLIAFGLFAYCVWRLLDSLYDFEDYGADGKGVVARLSMLVTGLVHAALGVTAVGLLFTAGSNGGGQSSIAEATSMALSWPAGRYLVGLGGVLTIAAGIYYLHKGFSEKYRTTLRANSVTRNFNWLLKAGVISQGFIVTLLGVFITFAAWRYDSSEAGGLGQVFEWLQTQPFGQVLSIALCIGLLGFALFCFVNARYRIIPKLADKDIKTLSDVL